MIAVLFVHSGQPGTVPARTRLDGFKIVRDDAVEDTADWSLTKQKLVRFVAEKL